LRLARVEML